MNLSHLGLFAGIGGFELGFEREGFKPIAFVDIDPRCRAVLERHWPETPGYGDIRDYRGVPLSGSIGRGQAYRAIRLSKLADVRADWLVVENTAHMWARWVPELRRELWTIGYASVPFQLSAADLGATHLRRRVFVIAHADGQRLRELSGWWRGAGRQVANELAHSWDSAPRGLGTDDGIPDWVDRRHELGNAVCPPVAQVIGRAIRTHI